MMRRFVALASVVLLAGSWASATPDHDPNRFPTTLSNARVDVLPDGKVVINFDTSGEYRGLLTFNISGDGAGLTGDWMLSVRYTDNTDPATGVEPAGDHSHETAAAHERAATENLDGNHPHRDYVRFVDRGVIGGTIDAASLDFDADGKLIDFRAQLRITIGTLTFDGATGTGLAELTRGLALAF